MIIESLAPLAVEIDSLVLLPGNPRKGDVEAVAASLGRFGQRKPIVVRASDRVVIAGNHTWQAAKSLGWDEIAAVLVDDDTATSEAFALADNRTAELGGYDEDLLAELIKSVAITDPSLVIDAGWDPDSVQELLDRIDPPAAPDVEPDEDVIPVPPTIPVTNPGDVWLLGPHRIMCGDCRDSDDVDTLMAGAQVNVAFTSPPYASQRTYDESSGFKPIPPDEYVDWFKPVADNVRAHLASDGSWFVNIKENADGGQRVLYVKDLVLAHVRQWEWKFVDELMWLHNGLPGTWDNRCKNQFEPVFHFSSERYIKFHPKRVATKSVDAFEYSGDLADASTGNPISWSGSDVTRTEGMALPGNVIHVGKNREAVKHEAMFPVALPEWFVRVYSDPTDVVYDPFMGSGSTLLAAQQNDRVGYGMEISPGYVDVILSRFQRHTGIKPVLESTGQTHDFSEGTDG